MWSQIALVGCVALTFGIGAAGVTQFLKAPFKRRRMLDRAQAWRGRALAAPTGSTAERNSLVRAEKAEDDAYAAAVRALPSLLGTLAGIAGAVPVGPYPALWPELHVHPLVGVFVGAAGGYTGLAVWSAFKGTLTEGIRGTWRALWARLAGRSVDVPTADPRDVPGPYERPRLDTLEDHDETLLAGDDVPPVSP